MDLKRVRERIERVRDGIAVTIMLPFIWWETVPRPRPAALAVLFGLPILVGWLRGSKTKAGKS